MRTIALSFFLLFSQVSVPVQAGAEAATPYTQIAKLASFLSDGEAAGALESFDKSMNRYGAIAEEVQALAAQAEILCSIDVIEDKEADNDSADVHHLDLDWYMTLKSKLDPGTVERRRERVSVTIQKVATKKTTVWRITQLTPEKILAPIALH